MLGRVGGGLVDLGGVSADRRGRVEELAAEGLQQPGSGGGDGEAALRRRHHEQQSEQMWCLTLATNAIVCWSTQYHGLAVGALRTGGRPVDDEVLAHSWPTHHANVHFYGTHSVDIDG